MAKELLTNPAGEEIPLGEHPETGLKVVAKNGRYGPFVTELLPEDAPKKAKPRTGSLFKDMSLETIDLEQAVRLLSLPRVVGVDDDGVEITAQNGRYGPYLKRGTDSRSLETENQLFDITLEQALAIYAQPKQRGRAAAAAPLKELGNDPVSGAPVVVKAGRFGEYVTDGEYNATLRKEDSVEAITIERAAELLAERRAKGPAKKAAKRGAKKSGPRRPRRGQEDGREEVLTMKAASTKSLTPGGAPSPPPHRVKPCPSGSLASTHRPVCSSASRAARVPGSRPSRRCWGAARGRRSRRTPDPRAGSHPRRRRGAQDRAGPVDRRARRPHRSPAVRRGQGRAHTRGRRPALERGEVVVTDRYVDSTLAYQGAGRSLDAAELEWVARWATEDLRPHLTVLLDLDPAAGLTRFASRDRIEGESIEFHQRVRGEFLKLAKADPDHYLVLDARAPAEDIAESVHDRVCAASGRHTSMTARATDISGPSGTVSSASARSSNGSSGQWPATCRTPGCSPDRPGRAGRTPRSPSPRGCSASRAGAAMCHSCHEIAVGSHPDVRVTRTEKLSIGVDEVRDLVRSSALAPVGNRWQVMVVEDADRLTDQAANALLKAIEEPTERTVWLLCAPTVEDVLPTIRSRTRLVVLATPSVEDVTDFLVRTEGARRRDRVVRRPRQPGPHRSRPGAGSRRGHPAPSA